MKPFVPIHRLVWPLALFAAAVMQPAYADIYTWVDASGRTNLSNLTPPEGAKVTNVVHEDPAALARAREALSAAQRDEVRVLSQRVNDLEEQLDAAKQPPPPPLAYVPAPALPRIVYVPIAPPEPTPYAYAAPSPPVFGACLDPWTSCSPSPFFGFYPTAVLVVRARNDHRLHSRPEMHHAGAHPPMHPFATARHG